MALGTGPKLTMNPSLHYRLHPSGELVIGGTDLVNEFVSQLGEVRRPARLCVATAFMSPSVLSRFAAVPHGCIDLEVITRPGPAFAAARNLAFAYPWRTAQARSRRGLHAKFLVLVREDSSGTFFCGSHNLTLSGTSRNAETGVLYRIEKPLSCANPLFAAAAEFDRLWLSGQPPFHLN